MAKRDWTSQQLDFITAPRGPILVSAAAGSGKTASVVERVIRRICDRENPLDPNRLLMTTFSNAAANEMLSRIEAAIDEKLALDSDNDFLIAQSEALSSAQISTIHSFCLKIVRENFAALDLFCDFRVVDEAENEMLMYSALSKVINSAYEQNDPDFLRLVELICSSRNDSELSAVILKIYHRVIAMPFPFDVLDKWLENVKPTRESYDKYIDVIFSKVTRCIEYCENTNELCIDYIADGAKSEFICEDVEGLKTLRQNLLDRNADEAYNTAKSIAYSNRRLPRSLDPEVKEKVKLMREIARDAMKKAADYLSYSSFESFESDQNIIYAPIERLFSLVKEFIDEFAAIKREKNLVDFSDAEQFMLSLLWEKNESGEYVKTAVADAVKNRFDEIYIDEYQDVNAAQEMIFKAIEPESRNVFMVGDVKQSIYGFRQADADIFEGKKKEFCDFDRENFPAKIFFDKNFRSRSEVTEFVNEVFESIMTEKTCGANYTEADKLKAGADYPKPQYSPVSMLFYESEKGSREKQSLEDEAQLVAGEIARLIDSGYKVIENGEERPCRPSDFCIMLRSDSGRFAVYSEALSALNIESLVEKTGEDFLESREMLMIRAILKAISNPFDDIALCAAMMSPVFLFSPAEIAEIKSGKQNKRACLFDAVKNGAENGNTRCIKFIADLRSLQKVAAAQSVDSLLSHLYSVFGLYNMVGAMRGGEQRTANLDAFRHYARHFEKNGYKGLGEFLRFVEKTQENNKKLTTADNTSESQNAVRIMTIHKSKGLEFPICILATPLKKFNKMDIWSNTIINKELGFGCSIKDSEKAIKYAPLSYKALALLSESALISEEMRVLYVALTRAKEKLIIPFARASMDGLLETAYVESKLQEIDYYIDSASNYGSWILMSTINNSNMKSVLNTFSVENDSAESGCDFSARVVEDLSAPEINVIEDRVPSDEGLINKLTQLSRFEYPYTAQSGIASHYSVSEISKGESDNAYDFESRPDFMLDDKMTGAQRGTALHTFMQFADFERATEDVDAELVRVCQKGFITEKQLSVIDKNKLETFFSSPLCKRILSADTVMKEYKFTTGVDSSAFGGDRRAGDIVLLQGVADIIIIEGKTATVIDYKTDRVKSENELVERYSAQLSIYCSALQKLLGLEVADCIIYSFALGKEIKITPEQNII